MRVWLQLWMGRAQWAVCGVFAAPEVCGNGPGTVHIFGHTQASTVQISHNGQWTGIAERWVCDISVNVCTASRIG